MRTWCRGAAFFAAILAVVGATFGAEPREPSLAVGIGVLDVFRDRRAAAFSLDYRFGGRGRLEPRLIAASSTNDSRFFGVGLLLHTTPAPKWDLAIGFAPGYYDDHPHGIILGSSIEFFSSVEISRELRHGHRLGLSFGHISNGSLGDENPGAETVRIFWLVPFRK